MSHLTRAVLAGGRVFPAGTPREGDAAKVVPAGDWWGGDASPEPEPTQEPQEPPRVGRGSGEQAWREYAATLGVEVADDATRDDVIAAVDAARD